jgi:hypothetical protein
MALKSDDYSPEKNKSTIKIIAGFVYSSHACLKTFP